jgi:hypothetical protein
VRTISFIFAFAFILGGSSMAGSRDIGPGIGTFAYSGSPIAGPAADTIVVAAN